MPTYLELSQRVGSESGTVSGNQITSVTATNDRVRKVVRWTADAYRQIQNASRGWGWLQDLLTAGAITAGQTKYTAADFGITRFAEWTCTNDDREDRFHITDPQTGQTSRLVYWDWRTFLSMPNTGGGVGVRPHAFTISPRGEFVLCQTPDRPFLLRAPYRLAPQELVNDDDVPDMPAHFHDVIVDGALILLATHDEAAPTLQLYQLRQTRSFSQLEREQLPTVRVAQGFC